MELSEIQLLDSLERALLEKRRSTNSQLKTAQKHVNKLTKTIQKEQKKQARKNESETNPVLIRYNENVGKQTSLITQLEEKLSTIELKLIEIKKRREAA